jgi:exonuclease SbcC
MITSLRLKGFRRYKDTTFPFGPGVNFIEGENNAGKTTLLYAVEYALFGRVDGFKSVAALVKPDARSVGVELVFTDRNGATWRLQRMHAYPPKARKVLTGHFTLKELLKDGTSRYVLSSDFGDTEDQLALALQERTGLTRRLFALAVHMKQGEIARILEGTTQLDIVLGVTAAVVAEEELRSVALELEKETANLPVFEESVRRISEEVATLGARVTALQAEEQTFASAEATIAAERSTSAAKVAELDPLVGAVSALDGALSREWRDRALFSAEEERLAELRTRQVLPDGPSDEASVAARIQAIEAVSAERGAHAGTIAESVASAEAERRALDAGRGDLNGRIERRKRLPTGGDAACEACGAPIDAAHNAREIAAWEAERSALDARIAATENTVRELRGRAEALRTQDRDAGVERARLAGHLAELSRQKEALDKRRVALEALVAGCEAAAQTCRAAEKAAAEKFPALARDTEADSLTTLRDAVRANLEAVRQELAAEKGRLDAQLDEVRRNRRRVTEEAGQAQQRLGGLEREKAGIVAKISDMVAKAERAARLRRISVAFKALQGTLRSEASKSLAADTKILHQRLSGIEDEFSDVTIDAQRYSLQVVPRHVGEEVPSWLYEGGGHRLLLGLAYRLAVIRLVGNCPFILLDEPTYGLDRSRLEALLERITGIGPSDGDKGFPDQILLITHQAMGDVSGRRLKVARKGDETVLVEAV